MRNVQVLIGIGIAGALLTGCGGGSGTTSQPTSSAGGSTTPSVSGTASSPASGVTSPSTTTSTATTLGSLRDALTQALGQEQTARATYQAIITRIGAIGPFPNIATSELQHISAVQQVANRHGITLAAANPATGDVPSNLPAACRVGVAIERDTQALYARLLPQVASYPEVAHVFTTLQSAAVDSHLPAFERCAQ